MSVKTLLQAWAGVRPVGISDYGHSIHDVPEPDNLRRHEEGKRNMPVRDWDRFFMDHALLNASMSTCIRRHVGAVAVVDRHIVGNGFNGNTPGAVHCDDGGCMRCSGEAPSGSSLDNCVCVHAEQNVVAFCARQGIKLDRATIYCTHRPCHDCIKLLAVAGVDLVVYGEDYPADYPLPPHIGMEKLT